MNLYHNIQPFVEYLFSIRKIKDYVSFDLIFSNKWSLPKSLAQETEIVPFKTEEQDSKGISFVCKIDEPSVTTTVNKIVKIIKLNKEREMKELLFKETIEELKKTFEKNDLDTLKKLYFDFETEIENLDENEQDTEDTTTLELAEQ